MDDFLTKLREKLKTLAESVFPGPVNVQAAVDEAMKHVQDKLDTLGGTETGDNAGQAAQIAELTTRAETSEATLATANQKITDLETGVTELLEHLAGEEVDVTSVTDEHPVISDLAPVAEEGDGSGE